MTDPIIEAARFLAEHLEWMQATQICSIPDCDSCHWKIDHPTGKPTRA